MTIVFAAVLTVLFSLNTAYSDICVDCHRKVTPYIVKEFELSKHAQNNMSCVVCHGNAHSTPNNADLAEIPTYETCKLCHSSQAEQFVKGKHSKGWESMKAMPTAHWQPMELMDGMKGCGGCHKIGIKTKDEIRELRKENRGYGLASCDMCHTRHQFSLKEALEPQACRTCHMGIDHPQWEMYSSSKHGIRHLLKQSGTLPENTAAPTCQYCHMPGGDHGVRTAWGFLAVRLPMPEDSKWAQNRVTILKALGVLDPQGNPTKRFDIVKALDIVRLTEEDWQKEHTRMLGVCTDCHAERFAKSELEKGDAMIREADRLMAEAILEVASLYQDLVAVKPEYYGYAYPDVLTFHDAPTVIEQKLFLMFLKYRMRTFQGSFHNNPDYALWYGWSEMKMTLTEIKELAEEMRYRAKK